MNSSMDGLMDGLMDGGTTILGTLRHLTANSSRVVQYCWMLCGLIMKLLLCFGLPSLNYSTANGARLLYFAGVLRTFAPRLRLFRMHAHLYFIFLQGYRASRLAQLRVSISISQHLVLALGYSSHSVSGSFSLQS